MPVCSMKDFEMCFELLVCGVCQCEEGCWAQNSVVQETHLHSREHWRVVII